MKSSDLYNKLKEIKQPTPDKTAWDFVKEVARNKYKSGSEDMVTCLVNYLTLDNGGDISIENLKHLVQPALDFAFPDKQDFVTYKADGTVDHVHTLPTTVDEKSFEVVAITKKTIIDFFKN